MTFLQKYYGLFAEDPLDPTESEKHMAIAWAVYMPLGIGFWLWLVFDVIVPAMGAK